MTLDGLALTFVEDRGSMLGHPLPWTRRRLSERPTRETTPHNRTGTMSAPQPFNADHAHQPRGGGHNPPGTSLPEPRYDSIITEGPLGSWFTLLNAGLRLNEIHSDFRGVFFNEFDALLKEADDEAYVRRMPDYLRRIRSQYILQREHCRSYSLLGEITNQPPFVFKADNRRLVTSSIACHFSLHL